MKVLYVRVTDSAHAYIAALAVRSGLSMAQITSLVIDEARIRGWQITIDGARVTDTGKSPAVASQAPIPRDQGPVPLPHSPHGAAGPDPLNM